MIDLKLTVAQKDGSMATIEFATVKLIVRVLTTLGYNFHMLACPAH